MFMTALVGVWLVQAAPGVPGAILPVTPSVKDWSLGHAFRLKQELFLRWQPVYDPLRGWQVELRPTWLVELTPTHPRLTGLSIGLESAPAPAAGGFGMLRPRLQYQVPGTQIRVGIELPITTLMNTASRVGPRVFRPMAFISGRF